MYPYPMFCVAVIGVAMCVGAIQAHGREPHDRDITVANLNILHGYTCDLRRVLADGQEVPEAEQQCRVHDRIVLLIQHIIASGCPDIVTLQENVTNEFVFLPPDPNNPTNLVPVGPLKNTVELIKAQLNDLHTACGFRYQVVFDPEGATATDPTLPPAPRPRGVDEELILTRYAVQEAEVIPLYSPLAPFFFRHMLFARIKHPIEPIDVFTTHLAADADLGDILCGNVEFLPLPTLPLACPADTCKASDTVRECQAKQMAHVIETRHDIPGTGIITGDFNAPPMSNVYNEFVSRGWIDSHLKAKNAECDPDTSLNCTAGRQDDNLSDLESREVNQNVRIDYIFVIPPQRGESRCKARFDTPTDRDHDDTGTGLFASEPNPFVVNCGQAPLPICWPSDHSGNQLDLNCQGDERDHSLITF
jgi:endonuclease/exonuclease/phosphatase family metal-dependent hydrolase